MKIKIFAAFLVAATIIIVASCDWFNSKKHQPANPLIGKWQLDSVAIGKDTSLAHALALFAMQEDSSGVELDFRKDTIFTYSKDDTNTTLYRFDEKDSRLTVKDSIEQVYKYDKLNDSLISLTDKDSSVFFLKRK